MSTEDEAKKTQLNKSQWDKWAGTSDANSWRRDFLRRGQNSVISRLELKHRVADKVMRLFEPAHAKIYSSREFQRIVQNSGLRSVTSQGILATPSEIHVGQK